MRDMLARLFPGAWLPAQEPHGYPMDLDGSIRFARGATGVDYFPTVGGDGTVAQIGMVSGFLHQMDAIIWGQMTGKLPFGPGSTTIPLNLQWQTTVPGLVKTF